MLIGDCFAVRANSTIPLMDAGYPGNRTSLEDLVFATVCVSIGLAGLALNTLSLVVFCRVFSKACHRNHFHLFFVLLSICEIAFCLGSVLTYTVNILSNSQRILWRGSEPSSGAPLNATFSYSIHLPETRPVLVATFAAFLNLANYLAVLSQFSRNTWVSVTALLRCYVATRRTNVQVSRLFTTRKVLLIFAANNLIIVALALMRTYLKDTGNFMRMPYHVCDASNWSSPAGSTILLHMPLLNPPYWSTVNMLWNLLSQFIPLLAVTTSSVVLVFSLRSGGAGLGSSAERNKRITRMVFIFALTFALLEGPRAVWYTVQEQISRETKLLLRRLPQATYMLSQTDSIVNAFIYFFNDQHFRKELCGEVKTAGGGGAGAAARPPQQQQQQQQNANHRAPDTKTCDQGCDEAEMLPMRADGGDV